MVELTLRIGVRLGRKGTKMAKRILRVRRGWVRSVLVNGKRKKVRKLPVNHFSRGWPYGKPHGIVFHDTAGCGTLAGLRAVLQDRDVSAHFGIDHEGNIAQFVALKNRAWHAVEANSRWFGVEHIALPGKCNKTERQMDSSVALFAGIIAWNARKNHAHIPIEHRNGTPPPDGIAGHVDGGAAWGNHSDTLGYAPAPGNWRNWPFYLEQIRRALHLGQEHSTHGTEQVKPDPKGK